MPLTIVSLYCGTERNWRDEPSAGVPGVLGSSSDAVPSVWPSSVPFVSDRASAFGRLLLATHEHMMTGGLAACDWLKLVTGGGGGVACGSSYQRCAAS